MATLLKKIAPKNVMERKMKAPEKAEMLYTVFGIARTTRSGEGDNGPWTALVGNFEAVRTEDGAVFKGVQLFLPEPLNSIMADKLREEDVEEIQFAVNIGIKPSETPIGYEYTCETVVDADEADPLAQLRTQALPQLTAPKKTAAKK